MTKFNTLLRVVYTLGVYFILSQYASAQAVTRSTLNFAKATINERFSPGFSVINPTSYYADVQFTYYGLDGNPVASGLVNPVRYRVAPKGQISMRAVDLFAGTRADGWVQVTSATAGLIGSYFSGDFATTLESSDSAQPLLSQFVPVIRDDASNKTELVILNPGNSGSTVSVALFNSGGDQVGSVPSQLVPAHAALKLTSAAMNVAGLGTVSARITASAPVAATAIIDRGDALLFVGGQATDQPASVRIAPHYTTSGGSDPVLVLTNPSASQVSIQVTLLTDSGNLLFPASSSTRRFTINGFGSIFANVGTITGQPFAPTINGWLRVDSGNIPLAGVLIHTQGNAVTSVPLESAPLDRILFSETSETDSLLTALTLVNTSNVDATVDLSLVSGDGTTAAQDSIMVQANSKYQDLFRNILPSAVPFASGYVVLRSSTPLYGMEMLGNVNGAFLASVVPNRLPDGFAPNSASANPAIIRVEPGTEVQSGATLRVTLANPPTDATFTISGQNVTASRLGPISPTFDLTIPSLEPGFATLTVRSNGVVSAPLSLRVLANDSVPTQVISGTAFYQKIDVTDSGLDLTRPTFVPVRNARVEVFSRSSQSIVAVSETDANGHYSAPVPFDPNLTVRVLSRLRSYDLRVADNTNQNQLYVMSVDIDGRIARSDVVITDATRMSGAFNILEDVQRANDTVKTADPNLVPPAVSVFWSTKNWKGNGSGNIAQGQIGTTYFSVTNGTAYVLGDRNDHGNDSDSDEFDDSVIVHEYGHMIASNFSRDDSPGGRHGLGDILDPRVAWSEGWANFFASAVLNDPIWRDSHGPNGSAILRYDLEDNVPPGDQPGYWSEASVDTILWDFYDDHPDPADDVQFSFAQIWSAFTDLSNDRFVYLPYFLEHFLTRNPGAADSVRAIVQARSIDFQPNVRPSVAYPFPTPMNVGTTASGVVDSYSTKRTNLMMSSHFHSFTTTGGTADIRMDIRGLGPGNNPSFNDLDIFLMDANGHVMGRSDAGVNGQSERIAIKLPAGTYVVEVRSYYTRAETGAYVYNSGQYDLKVSVQ